MGRLIAGTPYIIKWAADANNIENPVFSGVVIDATDRSYDNNASGDAQVRFIGTYAPVAFTANDKSILYLGAENKLYWPERRHDARHLPCLLQDRRRRRRRPRDYRV